MPEITVAITTYNLEKFLDKCIQELLEQSFQDFEIVIYDDCSSDGTRRILAELQKQLGSRLHVVLGESPLCLPSRSRNALMDSGLIKGRYVVFLDGDDSVEPDFLEKLHDSAENSGADMAICAYDRFEDGTGHVLCEEMRGFPRYLVLNSETSFQLAFINTSLWNKLILTELIGNIRMPEFAVGEDTCYMQKIYSGCTKLAFVDELLIHYRVRPSSVISNTQEVSIYNFAQELYHIWCAANEPWKKDSIALLAFIHIGLSMTMRAYDNNDIDTNKTILWVYSYFKKSYSMFKGSPYLHLNFLLKKGIRGLGIWLALISYKAHIFGLYLSLYKIVTKVFHFDIKF